MPRTRLLRAAVAAAALAGTLTPFASTASTAAARCADEAKRLRPDGWTVAARPAWTLGQQKVVGWAASPFVDGFLLATNGTAIARSVDSGCTWEEVYVPGLTLDEAGLGRALSEVFDVAVPPSRPGRLASTAYGVVSNSQRGLVVTSDDLGESWTEQPSAGLPPVVALHSVHVSPDPRTAFVLGDFQTGAAVVDTSLYVTRDGGVTFAPVQRGILVTEYTQLALDPADARQVWAWDESRLYHSADGGASFQAVDIPGPIATVDVWRYPPSRPARVHAYRSGSRSAYRTDDGGASWLRVRTDGEVTGATSHPDSGALATTSRDGVVVTAPGVPKQVVSPRRVVLTDLAWQQQPFAPDLTLYGSNGIDLYLRRFTPKFQPAVKPKLPPVRLRSRVAEQLPTTLRPVDEVLRLKPGERRTLTYRLDLAPVPTPLDIFFATDSTGSMSGVIASLRKNLQDIIDDLADAGIDVHFGVGDFKDYPGFGGPDDHPYKRFRAIGPIDDELERAIAAISIGGGNGLNSALTATYQAATGHGQRRLAEGSRAGGWWVEPGEGANWRADSLKVLVIAADVRSRDPETDEKYPGPTYRTVIDALNARDIEHVGLAVGSEPAEPRQSLGRVSRGTGTVAPPGGTDCDDDGEVDIAEGRPLVCELSGDNGTNLAPAIVGMLRALEDRQAVSLAVRGDDRVARLTGAELVPDVNVKAHNKLTYTVEAQCGYDTAGERFTYRVEARVAARAVAATGLTVECTALPPGVVRKVPPRAAEFPPPPVRAVVAAAVPPPPPPPAPVPQPQPQPNPNANPNPNPQPVTQVQAGLAPQEQAQVEIALAHSEVHVDEELAMSGLRDGDAAARVVVCAGMVLAAGAAYGLQRRTSAAPARVRSSG